MTLFILVSDNCAEDARTHNLTDEVERLIDRAELAQSTSLFDTFPAPYLVKKKFGGRQGRLVADFRSVGEHSVIVLLGILIRGSRDYQEFSTDSTGYGARHYGDLVADDEVIEFVQERTRTNPPPMKKGPTDAEYAMLYGAFQHQQGMSADELVCETSRWIDQVNSARVRKQLVLFPSTCIQALECENGLHHLQIQNKPEWGIWVYRSVGRLLLISISTESNADEAAQEARSLSERLNGMSPEEILRESRRAYPALILAADELWVDLEGEREGNMALSPEESEVLESARGSKTPFPLFINGRAGSGKSTILQYLFADILFYYLSNREQQDEGSQPPIYLTANGELLRVARKFVERLLRSEAAFTQQDVRIDLDGIQGVLDQAFREFRPYLISLLPVDDQRDRFTNANKVDYARFRRMWNDRFGREARALKDYGPEISWHVIRTYIKGMSSDGYLESEDYQQLPENQISVTKETFEIVFEKVWSRWYQEKMEQEGLWDDQDLTRRVLELGLVKSIYPAVFCDEAQDFTRLELEMLLRNSLFSERKLSSTDISRVPFAFAGDPFQTLNPTGFRWDAIKASFVEKFIFELDQTRRSGGAELNYRELMFNYRSTHRIVKFSNHVQAMRASLFQIQDLRPSKPWTSETQCSPVRSFFAHDEAFWRKFDEHGGYVVIIPCNEGEEAEFVHNDPFLNGHIKVENGVPSGVLSASRAKGCEYPAVVVYGFGAAADDGLKNALSDPGFAGASDPDKSLPMQYFINRLYVAVSRPKQHLVIVDSEDGFQHLWESARGLGPDHQMLARIRKGFDIWAGELEGMTTGVADQLSQEDPPDLRVNAKAFESEGRARNDPYFFRLAASAYQKANDQRHYQECIALAFEADGEYLKAGNAFITAGFLTPHAVRCFWKARAEGWLRLQVVVGSYPNIMSEIEVQWAVRLSGSPSPQVVLEQLQTLANKLEEDKDFSLRCIGDPIWREALESITSSIPPTLESRLARQILVELDRIAIYGLTIQLKARAQISFSAENYADASRCWEQLNETKTDSYYRAMATEAIYPNNLLWLSKLKDDTQIIREFRTYPGVVIALDQVEAIVGALLNNDHIREAIALAWEANATAAMLSIAKRSFDKSDLETAGPALHACIQLMAMQNRWWDSVLGFVADLGFTPDQTWTTEKMVDWVATEKDALQISLVRALARSDELITLPKEKQKRIADFLTRTIRVKGATWRSEITVQEAGAAFERAGRFTDAIGFYEALLRERDTKDRRAIVLRLVASKKRQYEYERSKSSEKAATVDGEIRRAMEEWKISSLEEIPTYPELSPLQGPSLEHEIPTPEVQGPTPDNLVVENPPKPNEVPLVKIQTGNFRIEYSRVHKRCNITNEATMEQAAAKINTRTMDGEAKFKTKGGGIWNSEEWKMTVAFLDQKPDQISIAFSDLGLTLVIT